MSLLLPFLYPILLAILATLTTALSSHSKHTHQFPLRLIGEHLIPYSTRLHWMRRAISSVAEVYSPCLFAPFGTVIVNHSDISTNQPYGKEVCVGVNSRMEEGTPILHGEITAIMNCTKILTDPDGEYRLSPEESLEAFKGLSLYTNAEACPMCASAIRWSGFREYIYGISIPSLIALGWGQIDISSKTVFEQSKGLNGDYGETDLVGSVGAEEAEGMFAWQYDESRPCPEGCEREGKRTRGAGLCVEIDRERAKKNGEL